MLISVNKLVVASYVGQTGRHLNVRIKEHTKKYDMQDENSSLYIHTIDNNHTIDFTNIKILDTESNRGTRLFSEALFIHTQTNYMNKQYDINKLAKDYTSLKKLPFYASLITCSLSCTVSYIPGAHVKEE